MLAPSPEKAKAAAAAMEAGLRAIVFTGRAYTAPFSDNTTALECSIAGNQGAQNTLAGKMPAGEAQALIHALDQLEQIHAAQINIRTLQTLEGMLETPPDHGRKLKFGRAEILADYSAAHDIVAIAVPDLLEPGKNVGLRDGGKKLFDALTAAAHTHRYAVRDVCGKYFTDPARPLPSKPSTTLTRRAYG